MTICNMSIEAGARAGMIAPDDTTFAYLEGRPAAPKGADWERALDHWRALPDRRRRRLRPRGRDRRRRARAAGHLGHEPGHGRAGRRRRPRSGDRSTTRTSAPPPSGRSCTWALEPGTPLQEIPLDRVFIGSCTNARIEDLRAAAALVADGSVSTPSVRAMVVPGLGGGEAPGRGGRARSGLRARGLRVAQRRLLDVPRHEPGHPRAGRALRVDLEPQLRGPPGPRRPDAPRQPGDGRRGRDRGPLRRRPRAVDGIAREGVPLAHGRRRRPRPAGRRHRPDHPEAVPEADRAHGLRRVPLLRLAPGSRLRAEPARVRRGDGSWSPGRTSAAARRASTRPGRSRTTASTS